MRYIFLMIMAAYFGGNVYVFVRALQTLGNLSLTYKILFGTLFWLCASFLLISLFARDIDYPAFLAKTMFIIGSIWMVFILYMVLSLLIVDIAKLFLSLLEYTKPLLPLSKYGFMYALGFTCCLLLYGYINYRNPKINEISITFNKPVCNNTLPDSSSNSNTANDRQVAYKDREFVKIVAISDVHLGNGTGKKLLQKYVRLINEQKPDVILIAGDLIDNSVLPLYKENMAKELNSLQAPLGVYMAPGNHEYISGISAAEKFLATTQIKLLRDSVVALPCGINIMGRDDRSNRHRAPLEDLLAKTDCSKPIILLDHQPYELAKADSLGIGLQLYGHTHRGQVWPLNWLTDKMYEQSHGYRKWNNSHIYVSSGLSLWGPPFRIGTHSDMALFVLN